MGRTQRELSFIRDLYINDDYTRRFTELADKHFEPEKAERLVYLNAGTGAHCLAINEQGGGKIDVHGICENADELNIARDKAAAIKADVSFSVEDEGEAGFDTVIADASLTKPENLPELVTRAVRQGAPGARVYFLLPTAGSFGEIFSLLWEVLSDDGTAGEGTMAEELISGVPTVSRIEELAAEAGLTKISTHVANEVFEYENGPALAASPLVADLLMPAWLGTMPDKKKEQVMKRLAKLIDAEDGSLTFRFTVKATVLTGVKAYAH